MRTLILKFAAQHLHIEGEGIVAVLEIKFCRNFKTRKLHLCTCNVWFGEIR